MATIPVSEEQYAHLQEAASRYHRTPEELVTDWLTSLSAPRNTTASGTIAPGSPEYRRRWDAFMQLVGSIQHGEPMSNEDIDDLIGEEVDA